MFSANSSFEAEGHDREEEIGVGHRIAFHELIAEIYEATDDPESASYHRSEVSRLRRNRKKK